MTTPTASPSTTPAATDRSVVPFLDVTAPYRELSGEVNAALTEIFDTGSFAQGRRVATFEANFARYCGSRHAIAVASGTDALAAALRALRLEPGDEVIVPALTFVATAEAVVLAGGTPIFVDVDERTLQIDVAAARAACGERTVGLLPVHLYGNMADMAELERLANECGLWLLEDAAQAHGATHKGRRAGSIGTAGCFSFYPGKNLGTCGEGGMVVTNDDELAHEVRLFRDHGAAKKYEHERLGTNARMSEIEAAILDIKLPHLDRWNAQRRDLAQLYRAELADQIFELVETTPYVDPVHHLFVVRTPERDALRAHLDQLGVQTGIHYPHPLHVLQSVGGSESKRGTLPAAERAAAQCVSLPMFPELGADRVRRVCDALRAWTPPEVGRRAA